MSGLLGDPGQIAVAAHAFSTSADATSAVETIVRSADTPTWSGPTADAYREHRNVIKDHVKDHAADLARGAVVLKGHAAELAALNTQVLDALRRMNAARDRLLTLPPDLTALSDLFTAQRDLTHAVDLRIRLSQRTADNLYGLISADDPTALGYTWPPAGWPSGGSWADTPLPSTILDGATFDPEDVQQGGIGDCYVISAVMALMQTTEGDTLLRDNIRWDDARQGYWVTLYPDGVPTPFFIDHGLYEGATENGGPGVVSLYEAAYSQYETWATLNGGSASDAFPVLTGTEAVRNGWDVAKGETWDPTESQAALANGQVIVASSCDFSDVPNPTIEVSKYTPYGSTYATDVEIVGPHAYTVVSVEADGDVWVMNPWGDENGADGGGAFCVSASDFETYFRAVSISGDVP